ncbi:outer membrane lipid asymmetry maintenance protein MlaD [Permianibacter aggregans]|nr:outer membrane lipid asymmetry maintenance protein MlaD [Permianibacter aggregans]
MMDTRRVEILVGAFVMLGIAALIVLALKVSSINQLNGDNTYELNARFANIGGLKVRSPVRMGGVLVGRVSKIGLDEHYMPIVTMAIDSRYKELPIDTSAKINTAGLLGEQYIGLSPGGELDLLQPGDMITETQSALVLEDLISKYLFSDKPAQ